MAKNLRKKKDPEELGRTTRASAIPEWQGHRSRSMATFLQGSASGHLVQKRTKRVADTERDLDASHRQSEKAMVPHSSTLAWKIPWTEEPGGLQSMGSLRVGHD